MKNISLLSKMLFAFLFCYSASSQTSINKTANKKDVISESKKNWTKLNGPYGSSVFKIETDSNDKLYLVCSDGVYSSTNNGNYWNLLTSEISGKTLSLINDSTILVGSWGQIFRSTDYGNNWEMVLSIEDNIWNSFTDIKYFGDDIIYASISNYMTTGGIYKSIDGGNNWDFINLTSIMSLSIDQNGTVYAGSWEQLFKSTDNGETWASILHCSSGTESIETIALNYEGYIVVGTVNGLGTGGVYISVDGGENWTTTSLVKPVMDIIFDFDGNILACTNSGEVFKSEDNGSNWEVIFETSACNNTITYNSSHDLFVGASNKFGVYRQLNGSDNWENRNEGLAYISINAIDQFSTGEIIAGTEAGAYITYNEGNSWVQINKELERADIQTMLITPDDDVFIGTTATGGGCIYKRNINDSIWTQIHPPFSHFNSLIMDDQGILYAGSQAGLIRSLSDGDTWENSYNGIDRPHVYTLETDTMGNIYAGTLDGIYVSENQGKDWSLHSMADTNVHLLKNINGYMFAYAKGGLYRKGLNDDAWIAINDGLDHINILSLDIDDESILYLSTLGAKIYFSENMGDNWTEITSDIESNVHSIKFLNSSIFFGSQFCGIYKYNKYDDMYNAIAYVNPPKSGYVNGTGVYHQGEAVTLSAFPNEDYVFMNWTENNQVVSSNEIYTFDVTENRYVYANFSLKIGVLQSSMDKIVVYPTPTSNYLVLENINPNAKISIYSISGTKLLELKTANYINVSYLKPGTYLLRISSNKENRIIRFIKQ
jgi:photosystem II stability/assembly factor-like uncharacterized protein